MTVACRVVVGALFATVAVTACGGGSTMGRPGFGGRGGAGGAAATFGGVQSSTVNRNVDLLFMIDDSGAMALSQTKMVDALPAFMATLQGLRGGMPNLHVAVVSSDMGGAAGNSIPSCAGTGKGGKFQSLPRGACTTTNLQSGATFISDVDGVANYTGSLADVLRCIAPLGEAGCDFEQPFAAITRALGADGLGQAPAENQGFLRSDANLAIVMLTNEDDCTPAAGVQLFDTSTNTLLASELGPPSSFRCNEFGHRCNGVAPSRLAPSGSVTDTVSYTNCVSAEGSGLLKTVSETAAQIKALKADPATQILVAAIQAPATPYQVHWKPAPQTDAGPWPEITHSCLANDRTWANPSVRATEFVQQFGGHGLTLSFCEDSFAPAMMRIAQEIGGLLDPPCITKSPEYVDGAPDCKVVAHTGNGSGSTVDSAVPACVNNGGEAPCWSFVPGSSTCPGMHLHVTPDPANPMPAVRTYSYQCAECTGLSEPGRCP